LKNNFNDLYDKIINFNNNGILNNLIFKTKVWHFIHNVKEIPLCGTCNKQLKFKRSLSEGYGIYCSLKCCNKNINHITKSQKNRDYSNCDFKSKKNPMYNEELINRMVTVRRDNYKLKVIEKFENIHEDKYDYSKIDYVDGKTEVTIICSKHGDFEVTPTSHLAGTGCPKCSVKHMDEGKFITKAKLKHSDLSFNYQENEVKTYIQSLNIPFESNNRTILNGKEIDIYIPDKGIAIEYNGLYWHSELYVDKNHHLDKTEICESQNIQLIHIFEDEWVYKQDIVKSRLKNILGITKNRLYGRKCTIKEVLTKDKTKFLNENHIQGSVGSKINLGLYYNSELVSLMTFGKRPIFNNNEFELIRFCNKLDTTVIGGASKLLKYFIKQYNPKEIISYADRRWSIGNMYEKLGFNFISNTPINWFCIEKNKRYHRVRYQKHKLVSEGYDENKTGHQICLENKIYRIYDSGNKKYILNL